MKLEARAGKDRVYVSVDGIKAYEVAEEGGNTRGLHIVVLNQHTGVVMGTRVFDTYAANLDGEIVLFLNMLQEGRIIVFLTKVKPFEAKF